MTMIYTFPIYQYYNNKFDTYFETFYRYCTCIFFDTIQKTLRVFESNNKAWANKNKSTAIGNSSISYIGDPVS